MKRFVVIGLGRFGSWVGRALHRQGFDVIAIDRDGDRVDQFSHEVTRAIVGDASDVEILKRAGASKADAAVVSTGSDLAATIMATLALKELKVPRIVAKVASTRDAKAMERFDVDELVFPEKEAAERLAYRLASTSVLEYIPLGEKYSIQEIAIPDAWLGQPLSELNLPHQQGIQIVAIYDVLQGTWDVVPAADRLLTDSDVAIVAGPTETLEAFVKKGTRGGG
jgi:trk system potassium uptake protein TrkA